MTASGHVKQTIVFPEDYQQIYLGLARMSHRRYPSTKVFKRSERAKARKLMDSKATQTMNDELARRGWVLSKSICNNGLQNGGLAGDTWYSMKALRVVNLLTE